LRKWTATSLYKLLAELSGAVISRTPPEKNLSAWTFGSTASALEGLTPNYVSEATPHLRLPKKRYI